MKISKERIDKLLVDMGHYEDVETAKRAVMAGIVLVDDKKIDKPGTIIKFIEEVEIRIKGKESKYVSRGGLKLEKAIREFNLDFNGKRVLDVGASTGGFTHCSLLNGATHVYAVDVGTNQLAWSLRNDERVTSLENTHIRDLKLEDIGNEKVDYIVMDVSFISIRNILGDLKKFFKEETKLMALIKPQFEVEKEMIDRGGIVRDINYHLLAIEKVIETGNNIGLYIEKLDVSPIKGGKGNTEYISLFSLKEQEKLELEKILSL